MFIARSSHASVDSTAVIYPFHPFGALGSFRSFRALGRFVSPVPSPSRGG
jgi:hypothetical protein